MSLIEPYSFTQFVLVIIAAMLILPSMIFMIVDYKVASAKIVVVIGAIVLIIAVI